MSRQYSAIGGSWVSPSDNPRRARSAADEQRLSFALIYQEHLARVYRYALSRLGDISEAQDVTSQTFIAAFEQFARFQGRSDISTWLLGIARHKVIDHLRAHRRHVSLDQTETDLLSELNIESHVQQSLDIKRVVQAMRMLSEDRREALSLHLFGELSIQETAVVMRRKYAAVQMLIQRGLTDLRTRLQEEI